MATPKIRIKRGSSTPTSTVIPSSGEMAIDTSNKKFYIQLSDGATPTWMGSPIDDSTWNNSSNLATQTLIENTFCKKATNISVSGVTSTGAITGTNITGSGDVTGQTLIGKGVKIQDPGAGDTDYVQLKASVMSNTSYDLTFPPTLAAGVMKTDASGNISFAADNIGVNISGAASGTLYYPMLAPATGTGVGTVYIDSQAGFTAVNGPLTYQPNTGTLTVNGDLVVNGQSAPVTVSLSGYGTAGKPSTLLNGDTTLHLASVVGIAGGEEIELVTTSVGGITIGLSSGTTITSVNSTNNTITISAAGGITVSGGSLTTPQSNNIQIKYQSLSVKITSTGTTTDKAEIFNTNVLDIAVGAAATTVAIANNQTSAISIGPVLTLNKDAVSDNSTINTLGTIASFAPTTATTVNIGNAAKTMYLGGNSTDTLSYNFGTNATISGKTKTINIGTSGLSGSLTNIVLGAQSGNNAHTIWGAITNTAGSNPGSTATDQLVTKGYVDTAAVGLNTRGSAAAATTGTVAALAGISVSYPAGDITITWTGGNSFAASTGTTIAIDGVNIYYGNGGDPTAGGGGTSVVILVKDEAAAARNGLYYVSGARTLTRISTADTSTKLPKGTYIFVTAGTLNAGKGFITDAAVTTLGTTAINWNQFTQSTTYTGSSPIAVAGNSISLNYSANSFDLTGGTPALRLKSTVAGNGLTYSSEVLSVSSSITVKAATTANVDLATDITTVDGVSLSLNDIYLVKNQTNPALNGIWQRSSIGAAPTRYSLYDSQSEINGTRTIYVSGASGSTNGGKSFTLMTPAPGTIATTANQNANATGPILYIENNTGTSYTPDNYYTIGAPLVKTADATEKAYYLYDMVHAASNTFTLNSGASITVTIAGWASGDRNIPADITPGLKVTKFGSADFTSNSIYISRINRSAGAIILYNRGAAQVSATIAVSNLSNTAGGGTTLELENPSNPSSNAYYGTPKGILVYNKKDYSEWSALQFTPNSTSSTDGTWSIINSSAGGNSFNSTNLVGDTLTQTLKNKTLDSTNTIGLTGALGSVSSTKIIAPYIQTVSADLNRYKYPIYTTDGTSNAAEWYSTSPAVFDVVYDTYTYSNPSYQSFAVSGSVHNLRTGTKLIVTASGTAVNINSGTYYAIVTGPNTLKFANTYSDAIGGIAITRTADSTINASNTLKIVAYSVDLTLGTGGKGSFGYIRMPTIDSDTISYDYIFGDKDDISTIATQITVASTNQGTAQSGDTYAFSNVTTNITGGGVYAYDTARTDQNVNMGQITSINGTAGANTVTINFSNTQSFTTNDWVTIANINSTAHSTMAAADRILLNYAHRVNAPISGTSVVLKLRNNLTNNISLTGLATSSSTAPFAIKNYEIYFVCKNNPEFKLGSTVTFSNDGASGPNELKIRGTYTSTNEVGDGIAITYTITSLANVGSTTAKGFGIRVPYICYISDAITTTPIFSPNPNYVGLGLNGNSSASRVRSTITAPTETVGYTGRRVLLNTLIDCGSY